MTVESEEIKKAYAELAEWEFEGFGHFEGGADAETVRERWELFEEFLESAGIRPKAKRHSSGILDNVARYGAAVLLAELRGDGGFDVLWVGDGMQEPVLYADTIGVSLSLIDIIRKSLAIDQPEAAKDRLQELKELIAKLEAEIETK